MSRVYFTIAFTFLVLLAANGQIPNASDSALSRYVVPAPDNIFEMFRKAGMNPVNHQLTEIERAKVEAAFAFLPPLHQKVLSTRLHSISFMDNMPNTALTSPVMHEDSIRRFNITFRAEILHETISEWATKKENTLFDGSENRGYAVSIEAGKLDAFLYVLLHEATHVVDAVLEMTPHPDDADATVAHTVITRDVWRKMNVPVDTYIDSLIEKTLFRGGGRITINAAPEIYSALAKMPFVSLYATASWFEDIAEMETIYHLTHKMKQPFFVVVRKGNSELIRFEPMKSKLVKKRLGYLKAFYQ